MAVPNLKHVVQAVRDRQAWDFSTKPGLCAYTHAVVLALHRADPNFVHLRKRVPKNGCYKPGATEGHAIDAALYLPEGRAVDFIGSAGVGQPNPVAWSLHGAGEYGPEDGIVPVDGGTDPPDPPDPPPSTNLEPRVAMLEDLLRDLGATVAANHERMEAINTAFVAADKENIKKPLPAVAQHTHRLYGLRTSGPE